MPRAILSYGLLTSQNQGGGVKKQGLSPTIGKNQFNFRLIKRKAYRVNNRRRKGDVLKK